MPSSAAISKQFLRRQAIERRQALTDNQRGDLSQRICRRLHALLDCRFPATSTLLCYVALQSEVDTRLILDWSDYQLFVPRVHEHTHMNWLHIDAQTRWQRSAWGVEEPRHGNPWQAAQGGILICPLTAFDRSGNRLGMGKGCFDLWLSQHRQHLDAIIGLAFSCQEVAHIPVESHDIPMQFVITEKESIACLS